MLLKIGLPPNDGGEKAADSGANNRMNAENIRIVMMEVEVEEWCGSPRFAGPRGSFSRGGLRKKSTNARPSVWREELVS